MINLNLIISFITCLTLNTNTPVEKYSEALNLIINSPEYQSYNVSDENYLVSEEVIAFAAFAINNDVEIEYYLETLSIKEMVVKEEKELLKLNKRKRGNIKIFFSEERDNIFFAEVFRSDNKRLSKYSRTSGFGARYLYKFKHKKDKIILLEINEYVIIN